MNGFIGNEGVKAKRFLKYVKTLTGVGNMLNHLQ